MKMRKKAAKRVAAFPMDRNKWMEGAQAHRHYLDTPERVVTFMKAEPAVYLAVGVLPPGFSRSDSCCPFLPFVTRWTTARIMPFDPPYCIEAIIAEPVWEHLAQLSIDYESWRIGRRGGRKALPPLCPTIWPDAFALPDHPLLRRYKTAPAARPKVADLPDDGEEY